MVNIIAEMRSYIAQNFNASTTRIRLWLRILEKQNYCQHDFVNLIGGPACRKCGWTP